jgi:hypothetical protein
MPPHSGLIRALLSPPPRSRMPTLHCMARAIRYRLPLPGQHDPLPSAAT